MMDEDADGTAPVLVNFCINDDGNDDHQDYPDDDVGVGLKEIL